jgi:FkbM family methyltransferase
MQPILIRRITRRNPFKIIKVPWIARVYAYPFDRWSSLGTQAVFGVPNFALFILFQKFSPFKPQGQFAYVINGHEKILRFNALNTQFHALYFKSFARGFEPQISALMDLLLPRDGVFYDIGSNWGWFSLLLASKPGFQGQIHAFEPFPLSFKDICSLIQQAGLNDKIQTHNLALSDHAGKVSMRLPDKFQSGRATMRGNEGANNGETPVGTLDSLKLKPPTLIKADVEGLETKVFRGGTKLLSEHKPMLVFEHATQGNNLWHTLEPLEFLYGLGYKFFHVGWLRHTPGKAFLVGDDVDSDPQDTETLTLAPFDWEERFLHSQGMNIFACHQDKLGELKTLFEEFQLKDK